MPKTPYSKDAPKHKGLLARAMEKDQLEQIKKEQKEKDDLMNEALNDPMFKIQMQSI